MKKIITVYELLGLVKENKQPEIIKYIKNGKYYRWEALHFDYANANDWLFSQEVIPEILTNNVVIISDNPQIEKLNIECENENTGNCYIKNENGTKCYLTKHSKIIANKLNEAIDKLNYLLEKSDKDE